MKRIYKTLPKFKSEPKPEPDLIFLYTDYEKRLDYFRVRETGQIVTTHYDAGCGGGGANIGGSGGGFDGEYCIICNAKIPLSHTPNGRKVQVCSLCKEAIDHVKSQVCIEKVKKLRDPWGHY